jgi:hypothetical protein
VSVRFLILPPTPYANLPNSSAADMLHCFLYFGCRSKSLYFSSLPDSSSNTNIALSTFLSICLYCWMKSLQPLGLWSWADSACFMLRWMLDLVGWIRRDEHLGAAGLTVALDLAASQTLERVLSAGGCDGRKT